VRLGIGDDCALLRVKPRHELCVTTDFSLENRHFRRAWHPPESAGHRCLARGLSDLAAMGAEPLAVFLSLALPARLPAGWLDRFFTGFLALARDRRVTLAGGDTAESPAPGGGGSALILADIVAVGQVPRGKALLRSGARAGDRIYVTGALGGAAAELELLSKGPRRFASATQSAADHPHLYPEPRIGVARRLRGLATSAIDLSDGLSTDLFHLCEESGVAALIHQHDLPLHPFAFAREDGFNLALNGGEDYELLFTVPPGTRVPGKIAGVPVRGIGEIRKPARGIPRVTMQTAEGKRIAVEPAGFEHFR
jgi:thiamine-monophosphate kinase